MWNLLLLEKCEIYFSSKSVKLVETGGCHLQQEAVSSLKPTWEEWLASSSPSRSVDSSSLILVVRGVYLSLHFNFGSSLAIHIMWTGDQLIENSNVNIHPCGWDTCFYLMGSTSLLWTVGWAFLAHDNPKLHPSITEEVNMPRVWLEDEKSRFAGACRDWGNPCGIKTAATSLASRRHFSAYLGDHLYWCRQHIWFVLF